MSRKAGIVVHERYFWHIAGNVLGHDPHGLAVSRGRYNEPWAPFENADTKRRIWNLVQACELDQHLLRVAPRPADDVDLLRVHTARYVNSVRDLSERDEGADAGECARFCIGSFDIAVLAAGGVMSALDAIVAGEVKRVYVLCRPPGHHAEADRGRGFCLFNNIAIGAKYALNKWPSQVRRIAIVDYDVHHGNGTEQAFYDSSDVLFISVHQERLYPIETGDISARGAGAGLGFNINVPLPPGSGIGAYDAVFDEIVVPALDAFRPDLILVSSGFDASSYDPLGRMQLPASAFADYAQRLVDAAERLCKGRICFVHEGGYSEILVPFCGLRVLEVLAERSGTASNVVDPFDAELRNYVTQALQPHQRVAIDAAKAGALDLSLLASKAQA